MITDQRTVSLAALWAILSIVWFITVYFIGHHHFGGLVRRNTILATITILILGVLGTITQLNNWW